MAFEITKQEILRQAAEFKKLYDQTRDKKYKDQELRLRRIITELDIPSGTGVTTLDGLTDVTISAAANGQVLTYDSTSGQWENQTPGGGGGGDMLKSTYDVDNDGIVDGSETTQIIVRNSTGTTLTKGTVVYLSGATGNRPNAVRAQADTEATSSKTIGIVVANIANNADGYVAVNGTLHDLDTSAFTAGDSVWLSAATAGAFTSTIPSEPNHTVFIGYIARSHPTLGRIVILIQNGYELNELHGVQISSEANNDLLVYESSTTLWKNKSIATIFGGTPLVSVPTLAQVTTAGNTTTNAITVGGFTSNASSTIVGAAAGTIGTRVLTIEGSHPEIWFKDTFVGEPSFALSQYGSAFYFARTSSTGVFTSYAGVIVGARWSFGHGGNPTATVHIKGSDVLSSTKAFLVQNSSPSDLLTIWNDGAVGINTSTNAGYKLDVNGTARVSTLYFTNAAVTANITATGGSLEFNAPSSFGVFNFNCSGGGRRVSLNGTSSNTVGNTLLSIPYVIQDNTGTGRDFIMLNINPTINNTGSYTGTVRGFYYNPTLTSLTGTTHRAIETTSGDVILNTQTATTNAGYTTMAIGGSSGVYFQMYVGPSPTSQSLRGQIWAVGNNLLFNNPGAGYLGLYTTLYSGITIWPTTGNVYVGASPSTDAGYKLDVNGDIRSTRVYANVIRDTNGNNIVSTSVFNISNTDTTFGTGTTNTLTLSTKSSTGIVYVPNGNVGIGTATPSYPLHISSAAAANIYGTVQSTNASGTAAWVAFNDQSDNVVYRVFGSTVGGTQFGQSLVRSASLMVNLGGAGKFLIGSYSGTDLIFGTSDIARLRLVDSTGNFLVGTMTDAGNKLEVSGSINSTGYKINNTAGYTGILVIATNPPGQQNVDIQGGIIVNIF